jgi:hypothetical protein
MPVDYNTSVYSLNMNKQSAEDRSNKCQCVGLWILDGRTRLKFCKLTRLGASNIIHYQFDEGNCAAEIIPSRQLLDAT